MELDKLNKVVNQFGEEVVNNMKKELLQNGSIATSELLNSLNYKAKISIEQIIIQWSAEDYAKYIENGRKPGSYPPISKIKQWCAVKGISEKAAYPISRSIYKFGIKPKPFLLKSFKDTRDLFISSLIQAYASEIITELKLTFKQDK